MNSKAVLIMTTVDNEELASTISTRLVEQKLAACVQEINIRSRYRWDDEVRCDPEILLLVKTSAAVANAAMRSIQENHNFEVPEIIAVPITGGSPDYLKWIAREADGGNI
jgi:periplasmic divalent cation tolerance protein